MTENLAAFLLLVLISILLTASAYGVGYLIGLLIEKVRQR